MAVGKPEEARATEEPVVYFKSFLKKKEGKGNWKQYWVVLTLGRLSFYEEENSESEGKHCGKIDLSPETRCSFAKRRTYSFRFRVVTCRGAFLFKCDSYLERWQWIYLIGLSAEGKQPESVPQYVPKENRCVDSSGIEDSELIAYGFDSDEPQTITFKRRSLRQSMRRVANRMSLRKKGKTEESEYKVLNNSTSTVTLQGYEPTDSTKYNNNSERMYYL